MDSDSDGDRLKEAQRFKSDNIENAEESIEETLEYAVEEEVPKILSPELRDVFHVFANMLDIDSFMRLAMTSKDMYKRCTEDKSIKIDVDVESFLVYDKNDSIVFEINGLIVRPPSIYSYHAALQKLPCRVHLEGAGFFECGKTSIVEEGLRQMKEFGVETIETLVFFDTVTESESIVPFTKKFHVHEVKVDNSVSLPILRAILSLDIKKASFDFFEDSSPIDVLLDTDSTIPEIVFPRIRSISQDQFIQLMSKIHSGSLHRVTVHSEAVNWDDFKKLPFDYDGPLPDERPLLFTGRIYDDTDEYWLLNWQGDVTKCVEYKGTLEMLKCDPWDYPWILRKEEDVLKDLAKKRPRVSCSAEQFKTFTSTLSRFSASSDGAVSKKRPLYFKLNEKLFWFLYKDDSLVKCDWENGCALWEDCSSLPYHHRTGQAALDKLLFWRMLEEENFNSEKKMLKFCRNLEEFDGWFDGYTKLDFNYSGDLPSTRPLVFEKDTYLRVVLFEDRLLQCGYSFRDLTVAFCSPLNTPSVLMTAETVRDVIQESLKPSFHIWQYNKRLPYDMFRDGFEQFKTSLLPSEQRPVIYERMTKKKKEGMVDQRWFSVDGKNIRKATWKEGAFVVSEEHFIRSPAEFKIQLFRMVAERGISSCVLTLGPKEFHRCLEQFSVVPFDYSGPLKSSPMAFVKKEIRRNTSRRNSDFYRVWFLWDGQRTTYCSWNEKEQRSAKDVVFKDAPDSQEMPPMFSSEEFHKSLLEGDFDETSCTDWMVRPSDLRSLLDGYKSIPVDYNGPLPEERPLVLETGQEDVLLLLRKDGTVIKCDYSKQNQTLTENMDFDSEEDRQKEMQMSESDDVENDKELMEEKVPKKSTPKISATVGNTDSGSGGERQEANEMSKSDNVDSASDSEEKRVEVAMEEEIPKILRPEIHDVFHVFANMLDIKSFMKLAMTCKDIYKRCLEDNKIKIKVEEAHVMVKSQNYSPVIKLSPSTVSEEHIESYIKALRKLSCKVNLRMLMFMEGEKTPFSIVDAASRFMKEIGVERIEVLMVEDLRKSKELIPFIKDFQVDRVILENNIPPQILTSMLDLNIRYLSYEKRISIDFLLESSSRIPHISLSTTRSICKEKFVQLLEKIQTGSYRNVSIDSSAVNWNDFKKLPLDYDGPLPDERPLLFARSSEEEEYEDEEVEEEDEKEYEEEFWFLHWNGGVTKCIANCDTYQLFKCEPWQFPRIPRKKEDIFKDLAEKRQKVSCPSAHFHEFLATFEGFAAPPEGSLPKERPLFFSLNENTFMLLDKEDYLTRYEWKEGAARCERFSAFDGIQIAHPALAKHLFWKALEEKAKFKRAVPCRGAAEYDRWFEDYEKLPFDYSGGLLKTRPVVFERSTAEDGDTRVVLIRGHLVQCHLVGNSVKINECSLWNIPNVLITADDVKKILQRTSDRFRRLDKVYAPEEVNKGIAHNTFCEGFELFKTASFDLKKRPMVHEKTTRNKNGETIEERWYFNNGAARKAMWRDGRFTVSRVTHYKDSPDEFMKLVFRIFAEMKYDTDPMFLDQKQLRSCLEQFTTVPFDYSGPLKKNSPMAFVKNESEVWFLWNGMRTTHCACEEGDLAEKKLLFQPSSYCKEIPPVLTTKEYLRSLVEGKFEEGLYMWHGLFKDFRELLKQYKTLPFDYDGHLPKDRPLFFKRYDGREGYILRDDGTVIHGRFCGGDRGNALFAFPSRGESLPPALEFLPSIVFGLGAI